jgi:hypothetical protein
MRALAPGLQAAFRLARGRTDGVSLLAAAPGDAAEARRSFWAAVFCLPGFVALHLVDQAQSGGGGIGPARGFALDLLGFVIGWAGFALISRDIAGAFGRARLWPRFVTLWNWCNFIQYLVLVAAALPSLLGLPDWIDQTVWLIAVGWALWLEWFMTRTALEIPGPLAAGFVALDVALGLFIAGVTDSLG